jgi:hypothetical protein
MGAQRLWRLGGYDWPGEPRRGRRHPVDSGARPVRIVGRKGGRGSAKRGERKHRLRRGPKEGTLPHSIRPTRRCWSARGEKRSSHRCRPRNSRFSVRVAYPRTQSQLPVRDVFRHKAGGTDDG